MNERYNLLYTAEQIDEQITRIASEIIRDHRHDNPLFVGLLRGAAPFATKLMFEIAQQAPDMHPDLDYMMISTYGSGRKAGEPRIVTDLAPTTRVKDRIAFVVDDVLEEARTANHAFKHLQSLGASTTKLAVLAQKQVERAFPIEPDHYGFNAGSKWLVGMGMDDAEVAHEGYRWLNQIWEVKQD